MPKKFTQEEVAAYFKEQGYTLISEYKNTHSKVTVMNPEGDVYHVTLTNFKQGNRPERKTRKLTQEEVENYFNERGYTLLSEYTNSNTRVTIRNTHGEEYDVLFANFKKGHRPENRTPRFSQEYVANYFKEQGYTLLSRYVNVDTEVTIRDSEGKEYSVTFYTFKKGMRPERKRLTTEDMGIKVEAYLMKNGYTLRSKYLNARSKIDVTCDNGHLWHVAWHNFLTGQRCPMCLSITAGSMSTGERMVWSILQYNVRSLGDIKREVHVDISGNSHIFDFMFNYKGKQYAIEYDGMQHYKDLASGWWGSNLDEQKRKDSDKDRYCSLNNIELIRVPYTKRTLSAVAEHLSSILNTLIHVPTKLGISTIDDVAHYYLGHTLGESRDRYQLDGTTIIKYFKLVYGVGKTNYLNSLVDKVNQVKEVAKYYLTHTASSTASKYSISISTVSVYFKKYYGITKSEYAINKTY